MCFDLDSRPPIAPIAGGALDARNVVLRAADGNRFMAYHARATEPTGAGIVVLPDVRGLHPFYEELALRFAEVGIDAIAIDHFGRTAGAERRDGEFEYLPHVNQTTWKGLQADITAAADALREDDGGARVRTLFTVGFCMGGRIAFLTATMEIDIAGAIGFYGNPSGAARNDTPPPLELVDAMRGGVLGIFGGADTGISASIVADFREALRRRRIDHDIVTYPGAPHSFFDRKAEDYAEASADAWRRVLEFIRQRNGAG